MDLFTINLSVETRITTGGFDVSSVRGRRKTFGPIGKPRNAAEQFGQRSTSTENNGGITTTAASAASSESVEWVDIDKD